MHAYQRITLLLALIIVLVQPACSSASSGLSDEQLFNYQLSVRDHENDAAVLLSSIPLITLETGREVYGAQTGTNIWAINRITQSAPNARLLVGETVNGLQAIFAVPTAVCNGVPCQWWFSMVDVNKFRLTSSALQELPALGNLTSAQNVSELVTTAKGLGFKEASFKDLPWDFRLSLLSAMRFLAYSASAALTDFLGLQVLPFNFDWSTPLIDYMPTKS